MKDRSGIAAALEAETQSADVVIYRSRITDARLVTAWLAANGVDSREVEMAMGSGEERERFHCLQQLTGWRLLPQIFVHGEFVGGITEFFQHPFVQGRGGA